VQKIRSRFYIDFQQKKKYRTFIEEMMGCLAKTFSIKKIRHTTRNYFFTIVSANFDVMFVHSL
jgi:hypothetical protein